MKEHALPQDITSYRFHIIGNMTLKQFAEVGAGCIVGFLIYTTNLPNLLKWPLILIAAGVGALAAFVPFEERPLDQWLVAMFRALYRPTQFFWKKKNKIPEPFLFEPRKELHSVVKDVDLSPLRRQRVTEFLDSIDATDSRDEADDYHQQRLQEVNGILDGAEVIESQAAAFPNAPILHQFPQEADVVANTIAVPQNQPVAAVAPNPLAAETQSQSPIIFSDFSPAAAVPAATQSQSTPQPPSSSAPAQAAVVVPVNTNVQVAPTYAQTAAETPTEQQQQQPQDAQTYLSADEQVSPANAAQAPTSAVIQNAQLPFPEKPTEPNKIVGMVTTQQNQPVPNAIVEVITSNGMSARAVKTNILGQFFVTTPLNPGTYTLSIEKDGLEFSPQQLTINDQIIDPIEVRSLT
jgi:hypothetical protein